VAVVTLFGRPRRELGPGAVHLPGWLDLPGQRRLVQAFAHWSAGPVPVRAAVLPGGHAMSVRTVCLGWHWQPYRYSRTADDVNGARVPDFPDWLAELGRRVVADAYDEATAAAYRPDTALVNWYDPGARMGMHQDKDEVADDPVVSLSVGDSCVFRFGNPQTRGRPYTDVTLASGDAVVFGRESRFAYHAVPRILPGTADPATGLTVGRINVTMRVTGLVENGPHAH
jgi:alkylated DNA repair protein (DNA oxidative demethylase)